MKGAEFVEQSRDAFEVWARDHGLTPLTETYILCLTAWNAGTSDALERMHFVLAEVPRDH